MKKILALIIVMLINAPSYAAENTESVYERVMRTQTIRCGYYSRHPVSLKDPTTGEISGIFPDYMTALGKALNLKVEWTEEIGLGEYPTALENGRIDAMCGIWQTAARGRVVDFPDPFYYQPLVALVRTGDTRFDKDLYVANDPAYAMAVLEGGVTTSIRNQLFPLSKPLELPEHTSPAELFMSLAQKKADIIIYDLFTHYDFAEKNPGVIEPVDGKPIKIFPNSLAIARGQEEFRRMLDHANTELLLSGAVDKILDKYEKYPGAVIRVASPYQAKE